MSAQPIADASERVLAGILLTGIAYSLFSGQDAVIKLLVDGLAVWQVLFFRSLVILLACTAVGGRQLLRDTARSPIVKPMLARSALILGAWICYYTAARDLQLAEMTTIYFAAPVIVTILSVLVLGESVPLLRWVAVVIGFAGVYVACDPANLGLSLPIVLVLAAAFLWALSIVLLRKIALQERTIIQLMLNNGFSLVAAALPLAFIWHTPDLRQFLMLMFVGALGGLAQLALFEGMKRAPASVIAPFEYTSLVWAFAYGYAIWNDVPRTEVFFGAALIVLAGLVIIVGEQRRRRVVMTRVP